MLSKTITLDGNAASVADLLSDYLPTEIQDLVGDNDQLRIDAIIQAPSTNSNNVLIGDATEQNSFIIPGGGSGFSRLNLNKTYIKGTLGEEVIFLLVY